MNCKIFMNFVKILKILLWIFEVIVNQIHINYKIYSQTSIFLLYVQIIHKSKISNFHPI